MSINFENLVGTIGECFDNIGTYEQTANTKEWRKLDAESRRYYERNGYHACNEIWDICNILGFDIYRLHTITRMVRRWEKARHWAKPFPYSEELNQKILNYLAK